MASVLLPLARVDCCPEAEGAIYLPRISKLKGVPYKYLECVDRVQDVHMFL